MRIELTATPNPKDDEFIAEQTRAYNAQFLGNEFTPISVYARDQQKTIIGGLTGKAYWRWLHIDYLWVDAEHRHSGLGSQLMQAAEDAATEHGCTGVMLDTFSFQAPDFYHKLGYRTFGHLDGYEQDHHRYFLAKRL